MLRYELESEERKEGHIGLAFPEFSMGLDGGVIFGDPLPIYGR